MDMKSRNEIRKRIEEANKYVKQAEEKTKLANQSAFETFEKYNEAEQEIEALREKVDKAELSNS